MPSSESIKKEEKKDILMHKIFLSVPFPFDLFSYASVNFSFLSLFGSLVVVVIVRIISVEIENIGLDQLVHTFWIPCRDFIRNLRQS